MLKVIDDQWKDHLLSMDHLKEGIGLRGYGQKDPLVEYKKESYDLFQDMMDRIEDETVRYLFFLQVPANPAQGGRPQLPFDVDEDGYEGEENRKPDAAAARAAARHRPNLHPGLHPQHPAQEGKGTGRAAIGAAATAPPTAATSR